LFEIQAGIEITGITMPIYTVASAFKGGDTNLKVEGQWHWKLGGRGGEYSKNTKI